MLVKKDRGRPADPKARPKAFGEVSVVCDVPGIEFLQDTEGDSGRDDVDGEDAAIEGRSETDESEFGSSDDENSEDDNVNDNEKEIEISSEEGEDFIDEMVDGGVLNGSESSADDMAEGLSDDEDEDGEDTKEVVRDDNDNIFSQGNEDVLSEGKSAVKSVKKRKCADFDGQLIAAETSLRALKRLAGTKDGILSNEDFKRIEEHKVLHFFISCYMCLMLGSEQSETLAFCCMLSGQ